MLEILQRYDSVYIDRFAQMQKVEGALMWDSITGIQSLAVIRIRVDTVIRELTRLENRNHILRDTVERVRLEVKRDNIPYEVRITEYIPEHYVPP